MPSNNKIDSMQAMRAFAATAVMMFHGTKIIHREIGYTYLANFFNVGFMGVDIFFVLSGFIIFYTSKIESFNTANFLKRRFVRVYPIYWLVIIVLIAMYLISPSPDHTNKGNLGDIIRSFTLFPQPEEKYVLGVAWTLTYEIMFYLVFAAACSISRKAFYITFCAWAIVILVTYFFNIHSSSFALNALINPIILNFMFGCVLAYLYGNYQSLHNWQWVVVLGAALLLSTWLIYYFAIIKDPNAFSSMISRVYLFGIPSAILIFGLLYFNKSVPRILVKVGDASYSLYLIHGTVLSMMFKIIIKIHLTRFAHNFISSTILFALTIGVSLLFYNFIEKPLINQLNKLLNAKKSKYREHPGKLKFIFSKKS